jgi:hypothetical protein
VIILQRPPFYQLTLNNLTGGNFSWLERFGELEEIASFNGDTLCREGEIKT